jgi:hypothetical protein
MSVKRNGDGSITIKNNNIESTTCRIIGLVDDKWKEKFQQWVQECAKLVTACTPTFKEIEQYFLEQCDALPLITNDNRMKSFQLDVIMNHCKDKLEHQASEFSFDMTDEEIEKWRGEENAMRQEVMDSSPQQFGLNIRGYYLQHTERNEIIYEQAYQEVQKFMKDNNQDTKQLKMQDICFFFEETTGHYQFSGGGCSLKNQLIVFMGVSEADIERRSQRFLVYIAALHDMGNLPNFIEDK